jgi:AraC-like DNA-binding protein
MISTVTGINSGLRTAACCDGPTVGASYAKGLLDLAVSKGASRSRLLERSGIAPVELADEDNRIAMTKYVALMRAAKELTGDPALALRFGQLDFATISIVGLVAAASETMAEAFHQFNRYGRLAVEVEGIGSADRFVLSHEGGKLWLIDTRKNANDFPELTESGFARMTCGTRKFGDGTRPFTKEVHVTHPRPAHWAVYNEILQCPTVFESDRNALVIDETWTYYKVARNSRYVLGILSEHARKLMESLESSKSMRGRVESALIPLLHTGELGIDRIAAEMALSRQTLYRKLKAEGVTYEAVLDDLRHSMARHYLNGQKVSVNETAYLVGFSDPSAFSRAFKRWTGASPKNRAAA